MTTETAGGDSDAEVVDVPLSPDKGSTSPVASPATKGRAGRMKGTITLTDIVHVTFSPKTTVGRQRVRVKHHLDGDIDEDDFLMNCVITMSKMTKSVYKMSMMKMTMMT